ncbi:MAG: electron transfer flavoprotein subunit beta/FixA family protein [Actinomycetota bacterium]
MLRIVQVVVFVKFVPEPQGTPTLGPDHLLVREGADGALDPGDEYGLELALRLTEEHGGEVTAVSMGPEDATAAVRRALAMGAAGAILVTDPALRGADALGTARVLAAAAGRQPFDLAIAGVESTDGYTGTVPVTVAELLRIPSVTAVRSLDVSEDGIRIERQTETGTETIAAPLPSLVTVTAGANEPRYPSLKGIMAAKSKPFESLSLSDLGLDPAIVAPEQRVVEVTEVPAKSAGEIVAAEDGVARIADLLSQAKVI